MSNRDWNDKEFVDELMDEPQLNFSGAVESDNLNEWSIEDDVTADWALEKILKEEKERDRLVALADEQIERLKQKKQEAIERCERSTEYLRYRLFEYMSEVECRETKTQYSYRLNNGTMFLKKGRVKISIGDKEKLIARLEQTDPDYVKTKLDLDWAGYKKRLKLDGDKIVDVATGEIVEEVIAEAVPSEFQIRGES